MSTPARYWREIPQRYRYEANKCEKTGITFFPPRLVTPGLKSRDLKNVAMATEGEVITYTVVSVAEPRFDVDLPYAVAIVEMADGTRTTAMLADVDMEEVEIGMKVKIEFRKMYSDGDAMLHCYGYKCVPSNG
ncbi:MAG: Zn-ribbon domain-containing OB-fold protein [FCB group bacterium]|nr:Zn-ribbon domain-containing OB-fold protein [FCB group bacterium]